MFFGLICATALAQTPTQADVGGRFYLRPQTRIHPAFNAGDQDAQVAFLVNARGTLALTRGAFTMTLDLQSNESWGARETVTSDDTAIGTHRAMLRVHGGATTLTAGRQTVNLHQGRFIADPGWLPNGRSYDGLRIQNERDAWSVDVGAYLLRPMLPASTERPEPGWGDWLGHASISHATGKSLTTSAYVLLKTAAAEYGSVAQDGLNNPRLLSPERFMYAPAVNVFWKSPLHKIDADIMGQLGSDGDQSIRAWQVAWVSSHALDVLAQPALRITFEQSSGDCDQAGCDDSVNSSFEPLYGRHHGLRGMADQAYGSNLRDLALGVGLKPDDHVHIATDVHVFSLTNPEGAWMRNGGKIQGMGSIAGNDDPLLGVESDTRITWKPKRGVLMDMGYAWFLPQGVGRMLTGDAPQHFVYVRNVTEF